MSDNTGPFKCFMVEKIFECWNEDGTNNTGAMVWVYHAAPAYDPTPKPLPHLMVTTPAGLVCLDCPETDPPYGKWQRDGEPPDITVFPSLNVNNEQWHGWLRGGVLAA